LMGLSLLLLPSTILHAAVRLNQTGFDPSVKWSPVYALLYLPLLAAPPLMWAIARAPDVGFFDSVAPFVDGYLFWSVAAISVSSGLMLNWRRHSAAASKRRMLLHITGTQFGLAGLALIYVYLARSTAWEPWVRVITSLSPSLAVTLLV